MAKSPQHEAALHTEQLWDGAERERQRIEGVLGRRVVGASAHGDPRCFRYQGAPNLLWAEAHGLEYNELIQQAHFHPYRFVTLQPDGIMKPLSVICLPHHFSLDVGIRSEKTHAQSIEESLPIWRRVGGFAQIMNHPDINLDALFGLLDAIPREGRLDWTAAKAADWWRRTHTRDELKVSYAGDIPSFSSKRGVKGALIEQLRPDGTTSQARTDLEPGSES